MMKLPTKAPAGFRCRPGSPRSAPAAACRRQARIGRQDRPAQHAAGPGDPRAQTKHHGKQIARRGCRPPAPSAGRRHRRGSCARAVCDPAGNIQYHGGAIPHIPPAPADRSETRNRTAASVPGRLRGVGTGIGSPPHISRQASEMMKDIPSVTSTWPSGLVLQPGQHQPLEQARRSPRPQIRRRAPPPEVEAVKERSARLAPK